MAMKNLPSLIKLLNKLISTFCDDEEVLGPDTNEANLIERIELIVKLSRQSDGGAASDLVMANRIAKRQGIKLERAASIMPQSATLTNNPPAFKGNFSRPQFGGRSQTLANGSTGASGNPMLQDESEQRFQRWMKAINRILKSIKREGLPADTTLDNFADRLEESAQHLADNPILVNQAALNNRFAPHRPASHIPTDEEVARSLREKGIDPKYMPKSVG